jgi:RNA polymerase sigma factor (sigma-70 family)
MSDPADLKQLVHQALAGDRHAVARIVRALERDVYGLALRMLWNREDAEDATQEILVRVVTRLSQFDFRSRLQTWVFRIATNYLLDLKKSAVERMRLNFVALGEDLQQGLSSAGPAEGEHSVLTEEVKIGCTLAMLQCLDREHRLAYVLGEILELPAPEAAEALEIAAPAFRKRLERARAEVGAFVRAHCGLVEDQAACRCDRRVAAAIRLGRVRPDAPAFARTGTSFDQARAAVRRVEGARRALEVHRTSRPRDSEVDFARRVVAALDPKRD